MNLLPVPSVKFLLKFHFKFAEVGAFMAHFAKLALVIIFGLSLFRPAVAMEFRLYFQPELKINVLIAEGAIVAGDADKFLAIVPKADRDAEGHVVLVLPAA